MTRHWKFIVWLCRDHITTNKSYYTREACTFHFSTSNNESTSIPAYKMGYKKTKESQWCVHCTICKRHHTCS